MDFGSLLYEAQRNDQNAKEKKWYRTSYSPPKKLRTQDAELSSNIQKFLAKREEDERRKKEDAEAKKKALLELRSQDKKSYKRVQTMLKMTKSANKSVLDDTGDTVGPAVPGYSQPDEDDYGYVSKDVAAMYDKLVGKYAELPDESIFSKSTLKSSADLTSTKDRVKAALLRNEEEKFLPRKRKRKLKEDNNNNNDDDEDDNEESNDVKKKEDESEHRLNVSGDEKKTDTKKKRKPINVPAKPVMDFNTLLEIAARKQHQPIMIHKKNQDNEERPLTMREKLEKQELEEREARRAAGISKKNNSRSENISKNNVRNKLPISPNNNNNNSNVDNGSDNKRTSSIDKDNKSSIKISKNTVLDTKQHSTKRTGDIGSSSISSSRSSNNDNSRNIGKLSSSNSDRKNPSKDTLNILKNKRPMTSESKSSAISTTTAKDDNRTTIGKEIVDKSVRQSGNIPIKISKTDADIIDRKKNIINKETIDQREMEQRKKKLDLPSSSSHMNKVKQKDACNDKTFLADSPRTESKLSKTSVTNSKIPATGNKVASRSSDVGGGSSNKVDFKHSKSITDRIDRNQTFAPYRGIKKPPPKRHIIESDDEYDSELDDFIDDSEDPNDYSKYISEIFGYDKSRYANVDDDDECMESNFSQLQKEEFISTKHGILEDLADIRQKKQEKERVLKKFKHR